MASVNSDRLREVLRDTLSLLCRNSLTFHEHLSIQGLLAVTIDASRVIVLQVNESVEKNEDGTVNVVNECGSQGCTSCKCGCPCTQQSASNKTNKPRRKRPPKSLTNQNTVDGSTDHEANAQSDWTVSSADEVDIKRERLASKSDIVDASNPNLFVSGLIPGVSVVQTPVNQFSQVSTSYPSVPPLASFTTLAQDIKLGAVGEHWNSHLSSSQVPSVTSCQPLSTTPQASQTFSSPKTDTTSNGELSAISCEASSPETLNNTMKRQLSPRSLRAERARLYRLSLKHNPALREKYEETKRKNRERMRRHRMLLQQISNHNNNYHNNDLSQNDTNSKIMDAPLPASMTSSTPSQQVGPLTVSPSPSDSERLWQDIHNWQNQPIMLTVQPHHTQPQPVSDEDNQVNHNQQPPDKPDQTTDFK